MNTLSEAIDAYLLLRRDLGFKLIQTEHWLQDFAAFMDDQQASFITVERALQWALRPSDAKPPCWAKRLSAVRLFARYRSMTDPRTEVPPVGLLPYHPRRAKPYLYTEEDIDALISAAGALPPCDGLRGRTYACLLGLLAVTGLRIGEALSCQATMSICRRVCSPSMVPSSISPAWSPSIPQQVMRCRPMQASVMGASAKPSPITSSCRHAEHR